MNISLYTNICDAPREKGTLGPNFRYWVFTGFWKSTVLGSIWCKNLAILHFAILVTSLSVPVALLSKRVCDVN